ncbi:nicotinate-nucleotide adenylyltransferase [Zhongshania marina]|uniref:Probable nicotinate-nucleotide adenylyltransferase n=1 Tax=Zhongshania marina TaxID=2304603 RepID=A0ABX9W0T0_9GAMM|nr:nicotinate-nucleotide adenylyltransferase [Zhongshania marina]
MTDFLQQKSVNSVAIFGGTFDPVHNGHLRSAIEIKEALGVDELRLMPSHRPPLRGAPGAESRQRLAMVAAAVNGQSGLRVDDRELRRDGPSYTVDTLRDLRAELGTAVSLTVVMGSDAFNQLHRWQDWQSLFSLANVLLLHRADYPLAADATVTAFVEARRVADASKLTAVSAGGFYELGLIQLPISATDIRQRLASGKSISYLVPDVVADYIAEHGLYTQCKT